MDSLLRKDDMTVQGVVEVTDIVQMSPECFVLPPSQSC